MSLKTRRIGIIPSGPMADVTPRIYVADLAAYNSGTLHGRWIDAAQSSDEIQAEIDAMLKASPEPFAEEWAIHDYEGFGDLKLHEYESIADVARLARLLEEHGEMFSAVVAHYGNLSDLDRAEEAMTEHYQGRFDDLSDWAYQFAMDTDALGPYADYIDWERVGHDAELGGDIFTIEHDGQVHVFWNH
jgi:antirestriction protein